MQTLSFTQELAVREFDVVVAGGGPAGCGAAIAAARAGARVLLIESSGALGGNMTTALVAVWAPIADYGPDPVIYNKGLALEILAECRAALPHVPRELMNWVPADPEHLKRVYDQRMQEAGVTVLFDTSVAAVKTRGDGARRHVTHVVTSNKAGLGAVAAKFFIDCTGDADLATRAGAEFLQGEPNDKLEIQPASLCFMLSNVDDYALRNGPSIHGSVKTSPVHQMIACGRYPEIKDVHLCYTQVGPGTWTFNAGHIWDVDGTDPVSVSNALIAGRRIAESFLRGLAEFYPRAFANAFLVATAPRLGIRETRRIAGEYFLTVEDYLSRRGFDDDIARNNYWIDVHTSKSEIELGSKTWDHVSNRFERFGKGESHGIPYRCIIPKGVTNVLVPGRAMSADRWVLGATRTMPVSMNLGEAAGEAAAQLAASGKPDVRDVDIRRLQRELLRHGAYLPLAEKELNR